MISNRYVWLYQNTLKPELQSINHYLKYTTKVFDTIYYVCSCISSPKETKNTQNTEFQEIAKAFNTSQNLTVFDPPLCRYFLTKHTLLKSSLIKGGLKKG